MDADIALIGNQGQMQNIPSKKKISTPAFYPGLILCLDKNTTKLRIVCLTRLLVWHTIYGYQPYIGKEYWHACKYDNYFILLSNEINDELWLSWLS